MMQPSESRDTSIPAPDTSMPVDISMPKNIIPTQLEAKSPEQLIAEGKASAQLIMLQAQISEYLAEEEEYQQNITTLIPLVTPDGLYDLSKITDEQWADPTFKAAVIELFPNIDVATYLSNISNLKPYLTEENSYDLNSIPPEVWASEDFQKSVRELLPDVNINEYVDFSKLVWNLRNPDGTWNLATITPEQLNNVDFQLAVKVYMGEETLVKIEQYQHNLSVIQNTSNIKKNPDGTFDMSSLTKDQLEETALREAIIAIFGQESLDNAVQRANYIYLVRNYQSGQGYDFTDIDTWDMRNPEFRNAIKILFPDSEIGQALLIADKPIEEIISATQEKINSGTNWVPIYSNNEIVGWEWNPGGLAWSQLYRDGWVYDIPGAKEKYYKLVEWLTAENAAGRIPQPTTPAPPLGSALEEAEGGQVDATGRILSTGEIVSENWYQSLTPAQQELVYNLGRDEVIAQINAQIATQQEILATIPPEMIGKTVIDKEEYDKLVGQSMREARIPSQQLPESERVNLSKYYPVEGIPFSDYMSKVQRYLNQGMTETEIMKAMAPYYPYVTGAEYSRYDPEQLAKFGTVLRLTGLEAITPWKEEIGEKGTAGSYFALGAGFVVPGIHTAMYWKDTSPEGRAVNITIDVLSTLFLVGGPAKLVSGTKELTSTLASRIGSNEARLVRNALSELSNAVRTGEQSRVLASAGKLEAIGSDFASKGIAGSDALVGMSRKATDIATKWGNDITVARWMTPTEKELVEAIKGTKVQASWASPIKGIKLQDPLNVVGFQAPISKEFPFVRSALKETRVPGPGMEERVITGEVGQPRSIEIREVMGKVKPTIQFKNPVITTGQPIALKSPLQVSKITTALTRKGLPAGTMIDAKGQVMRWPNGEIIIDPTYAISVKMVPKLSSDTVISRGINLEAGKIDVTLGKIPKYYDITVGDIENSISRNGIVQAIEIYGKDAVEKVFPQIKNLYSNPQFKIIMEDRLALYGRAEAKGASIYENNLKSAAEEARKADYIMAPTQEYDTGKIMDMAMDYLGITDDQLALLTQAQHDTLDVLYKHILSETERGIPILDIPTYDKFLFRTELYKQLGEDWATKTTKFWPEESYTIWTRESGMPSVSEMIDADLRSMGRISRTPSTGTVVLPVITDTVQNLLRLDKMADTATLDISTFTEAQLAILLDNPLIEVNIEEKTVTIPQRILVEQLEAALVETSPALETGIAPTAMPLGMPLADIEIQPSPMPSPIPMPSPATAPMPMPMPELLPDPSPLPVPMPTPMPTPVPTPMDIPVKIRIIPPVLSPTEQFAQLSPKQKEGSVAWKQGFMYRLIYPPYGENDTINSRQPFPGIKTHTGAKSAFTTLTQTAQGTLPPTIGQDMGIMQIQISTSRNGKPTMRFTEKRAVVVSAKAREKTKHISDMPELTSYRNVI